MREYQRRCIEPLSRLLRYSLEFVIDVWAGGLAACVGQSALHRRLIDEDRAMIPIATGR